MMLREMKMKIKCPSCDKLYRTYDAIITHHAQTGCLNKRNITKKLLNRIDSDLKEKIIRHKLKKVSDDIFYMGFFSDHKTNNDFAKNNKNNANNNFRILKAFILDILENEDGIH